MSRLDRLARGVLAALLWLGAGLAAPGHAGQPSEAQENEGAEPDEGPPDFLGRALERAAGRVRASAGGGTRLRDLPEAPALLAQAVEAVRGRSMHLTLLGSRKYMVNDCLGIKVSAGGFDLVLADPRLGIEGSGLVFRCGIERIAFSAIKLRMKPNASNPLELCKFSKKFSVEGVAKDVMLVVRFDPVYQLEKCRILDYGSVDAKVTIGNLNLKPLQNDLDRMAKDMVEDAINSWVLGNFVDQLTRWIQAPLEANCPLEAGGAGRSVRETLGLGGTGDGTGGTPPAGGTGDGGAPAPAGGLEARLARVEGELAALSARVAALEGGAAPRPAEAGASTPATDPPARGTPGGRGYALVPSPDLVGRLGRLVVAFPEGSSTMTRVGIRRVGATPEVAYNHGSGSHELMPGTYEVTIGGRTVGGVEVRAGHDTRMEVGVLRLRSTGMTRFGVRDPAADRELHGIHGSADIGLPAGTFEVEVAGTRTPMTVEPGRITDF